MRVSKHSAEKLSDGSWKITVVPPNWVKSPPCSLVLNADQYKRYLRWRDDNLLLIQEALPDLMPAQRELLMTGIGPEEFNKMRDEQEE